MADAANDRVEFQCQSCQQMATIEAPPEIREMIDGMIGGKTLICDPCFSAASLRITRMVEELVRIAE